MTKRLVAKVGQYEKNGETKGEYTRLGVILSNDNGEYALIDPTVSLAGVLMKQRAYAHSQGKPMRDMVAVSIFTDEGRQQSDSQNSQSPAGGGFDDNIPF